jgi:hypothetical protein
MKINNCICYDIYLSYPIYKGFPDLEHLKGHAYGDRAFSRFGFSFYSSSSGISLSQSTLQIILPIILRKMCTIFAISIAVFHLQV